MENEDNGWYPIVPVQSLPDAALSKREYFSGLAMQGICASIAHPHAGMPGVAVNPDEIAKKSLLIAESLLSFLEKDRQDRNKVKV